MKYLLLVYIIQAQALVELRDCIKPTSETPCNIIQYNRCLDLAICGKDHHCLDEVVERYGERTCEEEITPKPEPPPINPEIVKPKPPPEKEDPPQVIPEVKTTPKIETPAKKEEPAYTKAEESRCSLVLAQASEACDRSRALSFSKQLDPEMGAYSSTIGVQNISDTVTACGNVIDSCLKECPSSQCNQFKPALTSLNREADRSIREAMDNGMPIGNSPSQSRSQEFHMEQSKYQDVGDSRAQQQDQPMRIYNPSGKFGTTPISRAADLPYVNPESQAFMNPDHEMKPKQAPSLPSPPIGSPLAQASQSAQNQLNKKATGGYSTVNTNVLDGERGGGGGRSISSVYSPREQARQKLPNIPASNSYDRFKGLDLKEYLPGGRGYQRGISGLFSNHPDIHSKRVDLFQLISARFQIHCKLKALYGCQ